ncbi:MAG: GyrI-like domain-containing protein [Anaerolineae bacterium]
MTTYPCEIRVQLEQPTLFVRTTCSMEELPTRLGQAWGAVAGYLAESGEAPAGAPFAAYYNMDMQNLDLAIGFPVSHPLPGRGEIQSGMIPGGELATCLYTGAYGCLAAGYDTLTRWVNEQGREASGVAYEFYLNDPTETPEAELQTAIVFPLR